MKNKPTVLHVFPDKGGVFICSQVVSKIYVEQGMEVVDVIVAPSDNTSSVVNQLNRYPNAIYHFEAGAGDSKILAIARRTLKSSRHKQIMTVHDTGQFVRHPLDNRFTRSKNGLVKITGKFIRKTLSVLLGKRIRVAYLSSNNVVPVYLRKDLAQVAGAEYLPQPVYTQGVLITRKPTNKPTVVGYGGYWGQYKGLETIIQAWQTGKFKNYKLIVSGGTAEENDSYSVAIRKALLALRPKPELPGFVEDLDKFLLSLSILLLPYWPELPSGTSAMAMRAAELGVPIIASDTPALSEQLGDKGVTYIEPKNTGALVKALEDLESNWDKIQKDALQLSKRINQDHSWKTVGKRLIDIVEKAE